MLLEETKAPSGYALDTTKQEVEISYNEATNNQTSVTVYNKASLPWTPLEPSKLAPQSKKDVAYLDKANQKSSNTLPKTGENLASHYLIISGLILLAVMSLIVLYRYIKVSKYNY